MNTKDTSSPLGPLVKSTEGVFYQPFRTRHLLSVLCPRPTRLSSPPPRRSIAPICMPEELGGGGPVVVGGVRSRLSRSPRRSPWDWMTAGGASVTPAAEPLSGLSTLSPLVERKQEERKQHFNLAFYLINLITIYELTRYICDESYVKAGRNTGRAAGKCVTRQIQRNK